VESEPILRENLDQLFSDAASGFVKATLRLAPMLRDVRLIVPVRRRPLPGEPLDLLMMRKSDGSLFLPVFTGQGEFGRWKLAGPHGTLPALNLFQEALTGPFALVVVNPAGPRRSELNRQIIGTLVSLAHSGSDH